MITYRSVLFTLEICWFRYLIELVKIWYYIRISLHLLDKRFPNSYFYGKEQMVIVLFICFNSKQGVSTLQTQNGLSLQVKKKRFRVFTLSDPVTVKG